MNDSLFMEVYITEQKSENDTMHEKNQVLLRNWHSTSTGKWIENKQMWHHLEEFTKNNFELSKLEIFGRSTLLEGSMNYDFDWPCIEKFRGTPR